MPRHTGTWRKQRQTLPARDRITTDMHSASGPEGYHPVPRRERNPVQHMTLPRVPKARSSQVTSYLGCEHCHVIIGEYEARVVHNLGTEDHPRVVSYHETCWDFLQGNFSLTDHQDAPLAATFDHQGERPGDAPIPMKRRGRPRKVQA